MKPVIIHRQARAELDEAIAFYEQQRAGLWLDSAVRLDECRIPPGNQLEALSGDRGDLSSLRFNQRYRTCFTWTDRAPHRSKSLTVINQEAF
ncbi:MAG TPA: type II toxin-antitoxin system RelE/ParE family toxin [Alphaproteobacteria bacterium]|nr:type II toxin-antitoxin system RelE/ParE family toxin [Alphaproteobacteria bacterium]